jgi:hypothetical protein
MKVRSNPALGATGFVTGYEVDFSSLSTQDIKALGDGNVTIDGKVWVSSNTASAITWAVTNGTGIEWTSQSTPKQFLSIDPTDLAPNFKVNEPWRIWMRYTIATQLDFEGSQFAIQNDPTATRLIGFNRQRDNGNVEQYRLIFGIDGSDQNDTAPITAGHDLFVLEASNGVVRLMTGTAAGATGVLPSTLEGLTLVDSQPIAGGFTDPLIDGSLLWTMGLFNSNAAVDNDLTVEAMRVEVG